MRRGTGRGRARGVGGARSAVAGAGLAGALLVGALLVGCTPGGDPAASPTARHVGTAPGSMSGGGSPSGGPSGSPSADPARDPAWPVMPGKAKKHTPWGAKAFAEYYFEAVNYAWTKPDPDILRSLSSSLCKTCDNWIETAEKLVTSHERYRSAPAEVVSSEPMTGGSADRLRVSVAWRTADRVVVNVDGNKVRADSKGAGILQFSLMWKSNEWSVREVFVEESGS